MLPPYYDLGGSLDDADPLLLIWGGSLRDADPYYDLGGSLRDAPPLL